MSKPKLIIMVGNIASGKTSWIKQNCMVERSYVVLSKDDIRRMLGAGKYIHNEKLEPIVHKSFIDMLQNFMIQSVNIIIDETNMDRETRRDYISLTKHRNTYLGYNYETIAVVIPKTAIDIAMKRITQRESVLGWAEAPKEDWINAWKRKQSKFEMPTKKEGFNKILEIK